MNLIKGMERFLTNIQIGKQPSTLKRYSYDLKQFNNWLQDERSHSASNDIPTVKELHSYYSYLHSVGRYSPNTIRRILSVLKQWLIFLNEENSVDLLENFIQSTKGGTKQSSSPFLSELEINKLFLSVASNDELTDHQKKFRHLIRDRNVVIFRLILFYGVTIQELTTLTMDRIHFASDEVELRSRKGKIRLCKIQQDDRVKMFEYYMTIPEPVRPGRYDNHPFFIAFDYQRGTYRWDFDNECPKALSEVAMQKMIRQEMKRAGLGSHRTAQQLRKTYILSQLQSGRSKEELRKELRFENVRPIESIEELWLKWEGNLALLQGNIET